MAEVEVILTIRDLAAARAEVEGNGGVVRHVLTDRMILFSSVDRLRLGANVDLARV